MNDKVTILGTEYKITFTEYNETMFTNSRGENLCGYCDANIKHIAVCDMSTFPGWEKEPETTYRVSEKETLRHEIVHAFLHECGLADNTFNIERGGWANNEEMVDWIAQLGPKIYKAWEDAGAL